jgi:hypothetical protein
VEELGICSDAKAHQTFQGHPFIPLTNMTRTSNDSIPISSCVGKDVDPQFPYLPWNRLHIQNFIVREARSILALWSGN